MCVNGTFKDKNPYDHIRPQYLSFSIFVWLVVCLGVSKKQQSEAEVTFVCWAILVTDEALPHMVLAFNSASHVIPKQHNPGHMFRAISFTSKFEPFGNKFPYKIFKNNNII